MTVTDDVALLCKPASVLVLLHDKTTGDWLNQKIRFENDFFLIPGRKFAVSEETYLLGSGEGNRQTDRQ